MKKLFLALVLIFCFAAPIASQAQVVVEVHHRHHHHRHHHHRHHHRYHAQ